MAATSGPKSPLQSLLSGALMPQLPTKQNPELTLYLRKLSEYIRRLMGVFTAANILNELIQGDITEFTTFIQNIINITPPVGSTTITVETDWQYNTSTHKWQKKTRSIAVLTAAAESAWTDTGGGQPVHVSQHVTDVNYSTSTHVLSKDTQTDVYVLEVGSSASGTNVDTAVNSCS